MNKLTVRAIRSSFFGTIAMAALLLVPAGTLDYWQAWAFMAVFVGASAAITAYLAIKNPKLLERRMNVGPKAEKEKSQKIAMIFAYAGFIAFLVIPGVDHRLGLSSVPPYLSVAGDLLIALGFVSIFFVLRENSYGASTIQVFEDHRVVSTGPYAVVRHPMYAGALVMLVGVPLALGSWWGFAVFAFMMAGLLWRLLDEERFLSKNLPGYAEYKMRVRARLIPGLF